MLRTREDIGSFQTNVEELKKESEETSHGIQTKLGSCHEKNQQWGEKFTKLEKTLQSSQSAKMHWRQARIPKMEEKSPQLQSVLKESLIMNEELLAIGFTNQQKHR